METTTEPADSIAGPQPLIDPQLAGQIPTVAGYTLGDLPLDDPYGEVYDFGTELRLHHAAIVDASGVGVGRLIVVDTTGERPAIDTFVEHTFAAAVQLPHPGGAVAIDDEFAIVTNAAIPRWTDVDGNAVIRAEQEIDGTVQWAWSADDLVWIVRGDAATEDYVRALLAVHSPTLDPYDQQGMTGDLYDHTPDVPGYGYWDLPRANTIAEINSTLVGSCAERFYLGYILPDGVPDDGFDPDDLGLGIVKVAGACVDTGILDELTDSLGASPGATVEEINGVTVSRNETSVVALIGDVVIILASADPHTLTDLNAFIESFLANQPG